ncbi:MAG: hypothetical protein ABSB42_20840 [Tepidisphaeraceae bacterium]|jgi:hypothetical protein
MRPRECTERREAAEKKSWSGRFLAALSVCAIAFSLLYSTSAASAGGTARAMLAARLPSAKLDNVPLADAIDFLRDVAGVNVTVDWKALEGLNISKNTEINLNLHDVSAGKVLSLILAQAGPGDLLTYYIDRDVVEITTRAIADQKMITVVYYVLDLLQPNDTFNYTIQSISGGSAQVGGSGGGGGSQSLSSGQNNTSQNVNMDTKAQALIKLIETVVRPEIWRDNGGPASMEFWNGNLIVTAPRSVQDAIGGGG